jgi:signal transduction histidine kinase
MTSFQRPPAAVTAFHIAAGLGFVVAGFLAGARRPKNRTGLLMTLVGLTWFLIDLEYLPSPVAYTIGNLLGIIPYGFLAQLVLAFPSGRLEHRVDRVLVTAVYAWMLLGNLLTETLFAPEPGPSISPHILLVLHRSAAQNHIANDLQFSVNILLGVLALALLVWHWHLASHLGRRALAPAIWAGLPLLSVVLLLDTVNLFTSPAWFSQGAVPLATPLGLLTLPVAFLLGLVRTRLSRLSVGHLVVELRDTSDRLTLRDALARALDDPTLGIAYKVPGDTGWVDAEGAALALPAEAASRSFTILERAGSEIAALIHDRALEDDPLLVSSVAAAASLALENERLEAQVRAQLAEVRTSRARIVEVADRERLAVQRDIHDGVQQRLVALTLRLGRIRDGHTGALPPEAVTEVTAASDLLQRAIQELRELSAGMHPSLLVEAGLGPALRSLAETAELPVRVNMSLQERLPSTVEIAAYFVVSEGLANVAKHARAGSAAVTVRRRAGRLIVTVEDDGCGGAKPGGGSGLLGLKDRVAALDGTLSVVSPRGRGTRIVADLPCA